MTFVETDASLLKLRRRPETVLVGKRTRSMTIMVIKTIRIKMIKTLRIRMIKKMRIMMIKMMKTKRTRSGFS